MGLRQSVTLYLPQLVTSSSSAQNIMCLKSSLTKMKCCYHRSTPCIDRHKQIYIVYIYETIELSQIGDNSMEETSYHSPIIP